MLVWCYNVYSILNVGVVLQCILFVTFRGSPRTMSRPQKLHSRVLTLMVWQPKTLPANQDLMPQPVANQKAQFRRKQGQRSLIDEEHGKEYVHKFYVRYIKHSKLENVEIL